MAARFVCADRDQAFLMPPSVREWLPEGHLAWTVIDAVGELDLAEFVAVYRADGRGRPAYEPGMMVALLLYGYARGNRSARGIERACVEDVAYRVIAGNHAPDHSTIAEFRRRHETALAGLFTGVLNLCARAGLVSVGVLAIDGTKVMANASMDANRDYARIAREILADAARIDAAEDELYGDARGDELPEHLQTREGRLEALRKAREELDRERAAGDEAQDEEVFDPELDPAGFVTKPQGRRGWEREGRHRLDERRKKQGAPIANDRADRLFDACRRLEEQLDCDIASHAAYAAWRKVGIAADGSRRMAPGMTRPYAPPSVPEGRINLTDPDSRVMRTQGQPARQAYNAQLAVTDAQVIVAAEVTVDSPDFGHLGPITNAARQQLARIGYADPQHVLADAGYWHKDQIQKLAGDGITPLVPPDGGLRTTPRPGWTGGLYDFMRRTLQTPEGERLYGLRKTLVEPVFGQIKHNRKITRFQRRGRAACHSEWRLIAATHNLLKLHAATA